MDGGGGGGSGGGGGVRVGRSASVGEESMSICHCRIKIASFIPSPHLTSPSHIIQAWDNGFLRDQG